MTKERQHQYDIAYMKMAYAISELSYANRNKVGCIIVSKDGQVISQGFNGTPSGYDNCCETLVCNSNSRYDCIKYTGQIQDVISFKYCHDCEELKLVTKPEVLHAESNAISKCAKQMSSTDNATLYVTLSPCFDCAKIIIQSGIKRVCYSELYRDDSGLKFLEKNNIKIEQINI